MNRLEVTVHLPIRLAVIQVDGVRAVGDDAAYRDLCRCAERYHTDYAGRGITAPGAVPGVEVARDLFHALGIDPTRHRPCSEALLNRALKGKPQPRVGTLVDVGNWCALDFLLPLGIYDRDKIHGDVVLRQGRESEGYLALNGRDIHLSGRYTLADDQGPFGSPITDSQRAAVSESTRRTTVILYTPIGYSSAGLAARGESLAERVVRHCGGNVVQNEILAGATEPPRT